MTGLPNFNEPSFVEGAKLLRSAGWFVFNPVENDAEAGIVLGGTEGNEDFDFHAAMARDLEQVCKSDALFVLPGWEYSTGAEIETWVAARMGIPVYTLLEGREVDPPNVVVHDFHTHKLNAGEIAPADYDAMLTFETGANRNRKDDELRFEGFLSPLTLLMFGEYMHQHRFTADGSVREPDNWQNGIPLDSYMDSMWRHVMDLWLHHRGHPELARESLKEALSGLFFNVQGYAHESIKAGTVTLREGSGS